MLLVVPMQVIQHQAAPNPVAIIKDDRASRIAVLGHLGMRDGFAMNSLRLAKQKPDRVEIMNRMIENLEPRSALQERPKRMS